MARRSSRNDPYGDQHREEEETPAVVITCWLCGRPMGKTIVQHHPVPKSRGGRDTVPMHPICQQTLITNFTNSELQRYGMDVEGLLANPNVRKFVDWVAKKDPDFTAAITKKQR
jgi:5-methylcytosine-specific restriction endonuclease McrA